MSEYKIRSKCAICGNFDLAIIMKYGKIPLAGNFPSKEDMGIEDRYDLNILFCSQCSLLQTDSIIDADTLFKDYRYMSSIGLTKHFTEVAAMLKDRFSLDQSSAVLEIGSNDGVLQKPLDDLGVTCVGFEPAVNISEIAYNKGLHTINDYFSYESIKELYDHDIDLVISNNSFAHIDDIHSIAKGVKHCLKDDGHFVIEVHYLKNLIERMQYDNIYHEHIYYYSLTSLKNLFDQYEMTIVDFEEIPVHCGSIRVFVKNSHEPPCEKILRKIEEESKDGLDSLSYFKNFASDVSKHIKVISSSLNDIVKDNRVVGYGASGRANMICNLCHLTPEIVEYIVDESPERAGRYIAGAHIPIVPRDRLDKDNPGFVVIFAWNFAKMIIDKLDRKDLKYIVAFPHFQIVSSSDELKIGL